eukprot:CAMPEP_0115744494 /NCGR_PEP_ID=MMETSP0272-20121206/91633_1 /TAXON_ID=71861 /ORGANISM="Scrippsiella trochoidea, Strain CCMP3099" /LENGTH=55 /DNA_ID=CAMNT_0003189371 /DNA_START=284 /DNA_END=451 /DNA_ORIENTATION=+
MGCATSPEPNAAVVVGDRQDAQQEMYDRNSDATVSTLQEHDAVDVTGQPPTLQQP